MTVIEDLPAGLIEALLRDATPEQAGRAFRRLVRVMEGPGFVLDDVEDERAAEWLAGIVGRLRLLGVEA